MSDKDVIDPSNPEDVKEQEKATKEDVKDKEEKDLTPEEVAKLRESKRNLDIALKKEREEKKTTQAELEELRKFKSDLEEKDKIKKWKLEELLADKDKTIQELTDKAKSFDELMAQRKQELETKLAEITAKVSPEELEESKDILEDLSDEKKIKFLEKIMNTNKKDSFDPETKDKKEKATDLQMLEEKLSKGKLSPTERSEYLTLLRKSATN